MSFGATKLSINGELQNSQESVQNNTADALNKAANQNSLQSHVGAPIISNTRITDITDSQLNLRYTLDDGGESSTVTINYRVNGGVVQTLGTFPNNQSGNLSINFNYPQGDLGANYEWQIFAENPTFGTGNTDIASTYIVPDPVPSSEPSIEVLILESRRATVDFSSATSIGVDGYLIAVTEGEQSGGANGYQFGEMPMDFINYQLLSTLGDGTFSSEVKAVITDPNQIQAEIDLNRDMTDYVITLIPFNWNGINADSKNYDDGSNVINIDLTTPNDIDVFRQPSDLIGCNGEEDRGLSILAGDSQGGDLNYQWMKDGKDLTEGVEIPLATTESGIIFSNLSHTLSGVYTCDVWKTNETRAEGITSDPVVVFAVQQPEITKQPVSVYAEEGETAQMHVEANIYGEIPPSYKTNVQWYIGNIPLENNDKIAGAQSSMITVSNVSSDEYGAEIWCQLSGYCGTINSNTVTIMEPPMVSFINEVSPSAATFCDGETVMATASATATNGAAINYEWFANGTKLIDGNGVSGSESATLTWRVSGGTTYNITCRASTEGGIFAESNGSVYAKRIPIISTQPMDASPKAGESVTFTVDYDGDEPVTVEWFRSSNTATAIGSGKELVLENVDGTFEDGYYAEVRNECGFDVSETASLTITTGGQAPLSVIDENKYDLSNSPNPFDSQTTIMYNLVKSANVRLMIQDAVGNVIAQPINGLQQAGNHTFDLNANKLNLSNGAYFYTLIVDGEQFTKQMILVR